MPEMSMSEWENKIVEPTDINCVTPDGKSYQCAITPLSPKTEFISHVYNQQGDFIYNLPVDGKINLAFQVKSDEGYLVPIGVAGMDIKEDVLVVNMVQRVRASVEEKDGQDETVQIADDEEIEFGKIREDVEHPMKNLMQGKDKIQWQKILLNEAVVTAQKNNLKAVRLLSGLSSRFIGRGHPLSLAVSEYDKVVVDEQEECSPYNSSGVLIPQENVYKIKNVIRRIKEGKIKDIEQATVELGKENVPAYWEKKIVPAEQAL